jgi:MFS transporter, ACS family, glucarate transporter
MHDAAVSERPSGVRWQVFALACGCSFLLYLHRYTWNIIGPKLQDTYEFSHTEAGWVFAAFYVTYAAGQIPSGVFVDRFGPHRFLSTIAVLWSACLAGFGLTGNVLALVGLRATFGAAQAGCYPGLTKVTRSWFPLRSRTMIQGWVATTFGRAGGAMSSILLATVLMGWCGLSWQAGLWVFTACGIAFAAAFWLLYRNTPEEHPAVNAGELSVIREGQVAAAPQTGVLPWGKAFRNRSLRVFVVQQYLDAGSDVVFVSLIGAYFLQAHGVNIKETGWLVSLPLWGGALGGIIGGWLNDRIIASTGSRRWARSLIGAVGKILGCVCLLLMATMASPLYAGLMLGVAKFFSDWSQPTTWGTCTDLGGRFSATVFSIINTAGTLGGVFMPPIFGLLLDVFTTSQTVADKVISTTNWSPLFYLIAAMYLISGLCWLLVDCTKTLDRPEEALP